MTRDTDLMPEACRIRLGHRSWVRDWILRYSVATLLVVAATVGTEIREQSKRVRVAALQKEVDFSVEQSQRAQTLQATIETYELALEQHDDLATPLPVTVALRALGACTPDTVTLTSLAMLPRLVRERAVTPGQPGAEKRWLLFELKGVSPSDTDLAQFLAALETNPLFSSATVDFTTETTINGTEAREFGITCEIALEREFIVATGGDS